MVRAALGGQHHLTMPFPEAGAVFGRIFIHASRAANAVLIGRVRLIWH
jgi:hypothetical protein